jgi:elongation factor G
MEKELQHSLDVGITGFTTHGKHINLLDTPGFPDFLGRALSVLSAVETGAIVVNAENGIESLTQRMWKAADRRNLCRMFIVNRIDADGVDLGELTRRCARPSAPSACPSTCPPTAASASSTASSTPSGEGADFSSVEEAHSQIIDQVVEVDEALMEVYLEQGQELKPEQLHDAFEEALREAHLVPDLLLLRRDRRRHPGAAGDPGAADAEPGRGQPAAVHEGRRRRHAAGAGLAGP